MEDKTQRAIREVLQASTLLNPLSEEEIEALANSSRVGRAQRGEVIWSHGSEVDFFGVVGRGFVKMVKCCPRGTDVTVEIMGPGQVFGLMGAVDTQGCPLSAIALSKMIYLRVPKAVFRKVYQEGKDVQHGLLLRMSRRMKQNLDMMSRMSTGKVEERVAAVLFMLAESFGERRDGKIELLIPLTRQEIGELAGTTTESAIRTISKWQKAGFITTDSHRLTIQDIPALECVLRG